MKSIIGAKYKLHHALAYLGIYSKPDFLGVGIEKTGTTSLFLYLLDHPDVRHPVTKELRFFDLYYDRGLRWYWSRFPLPVPGISFVTGEFSPSYFFTPGAPQRMAAHLPNAKLIVMLRDPVVRAFSHYTMHVETRPMTPLSVLLEQEKDLLQKYGFEWFERDDVGAFDRENAYLTRGLYAALLKHWFAHIPREQFLILKSEDFFAHTEAQVKAVLEFIGVNPQRYPDHKTFTNYNPGRYEAQMPDDIRRQLTEFYRPHNRELAALLNWNLSDWGQ